MSKTYECASEVDRARELLEDPDILNRAARLIDELGLCGEDANRRMVFLAGVGGMLGEPIHLVIKGDSSGGKNTLANAALELLPEGTVLAISGLSPQALAYFGEGEEGKEKRIEGVLMIDEAEGLQGAEYIIRQAMSEGRVARLTVGKDESGAWGGKKLSVDVTASIITTTTETALHRENQTRVFDLWIDESDEQTRRVLGMMAEQAAGGEPAEDVQARLEVWREALSLLEPLEVTIPFARDLAESFPTSQLRLRRDFGRVLSLVRISALLHQGQRPRLPDGSVIADLADYEVAYRLLQEILEPTIQGLTPTALELCELHDEAAATGGDGWVMRKELEREAGIHGIASPNTVRKWCKQLSELGYWQGETRGPFNAWHHRKLRDPKDESVLLPRPEDLNRPDLPMGPNSLLGRRKGTNHTASEAAPNASASETPAQEREAASEVDPSESKDWEGAENPHQDSEKSSHTPIWGELDPEEEAGHRRVRIPVGLIDGDRS